MTSGSLLLYVESNQQNKLLNKIETEAGTHGAGAGGKTGKGLNKKPCLSHRHRQQHGDSPGGRSVGGQGMGVGGGGPSGGKRGQRLCLG